MINSGWDGDVTKGLPDVAQLCFRAGDKGESNNWPLMLKIVLRTIGILTGKTNAEVRAAVRQAFTELS